MVTLRNVAVEAIFGLKWGESGRYPTVVIKEKRQAVKQFLISQLGMELGKSPDFERMYVIKIRGSEYEIMEELAKFGYHEARFLNLRFIEIRQIRGVANKVGSVIRYGVPLIGLGTELSLTRKVGTATLLYQLDESLTDNGKLLLSVAPTKDGNSKLSIYAAFDYKRGKSFLSRILWWIAKAFFPEFVHDVVWNHALCTIKELIEQQHSQTSQSPIQRPNP